MNNIKTRKHQIAVYGRQCIVQQFTRQIVSQALILILPKKSIGQFQFLSVRLRERQLQRKVIC